MKKQIYSFTTFLLMTLLITTIGCNKEDNNNLTGNSLKYTLSEVDNSDVSGDIVFNELDDGQLQVEIQLDGTTNGQSLPAHVHMNSALMGGSIIISLDPVDGATGSSITLVNTFDDGTPLNLQTIQDLDAYVNIHKSSNELNVIMAQGDIGSNLLTGDEITYDLEERDVDGISGTVTFKERLNGYAIAEINLTNTPDGGEHPAHIHRNSYVEGGDILLSFIPVDGSTGMSLTEIRTNDSGEDFNYTDVLAVNGYVNVHLSANELGTIVAQGDIGLNELTGESLTYVLDTKDVPGIKGNVIFSERKDGTIFSKIELEGTPTGGEHPAHIHMNSKSEGGPIAVTFNPVDGDSGISLTSIRTFDDGSNMNYELLKSYDGYVNVHKSSSELDVIVAQGNIGINN